MGEILEWKTYHSKHASALLDGAAAAEETDDEHESADADENDAGVADKGAAVLERLEHLDVVADVIVHEHPYPETQ